MKIEEQIIYRGQRDFVAKLTSKIRDFYRSSGNNSLKISFFDISWLATLFEGRYRVAGNAQIVYLYDICFTISNVRDQELQFGVDIFLTPHITPVLYLLLGYIGADPSVFARVSNAPKPIEFIRYRGTSQVEISHFNLEFFWWHKKFFKISTTCFDTIYIKPIERNLDLFIREIQQYNPGITALEFYAGVDFINELINSVHRRFTYWFEHIILNAVSSFDNVKIFTKRKIVKVL